MCGITAKERGRCGLIRDAVHSDTSHRYSSSRRAVVELIFRTVHWYYSSNTPRYAPSATRRSIYDTTTNNTVVRVQPVFATAMPRQKL